MVAILAATMLVIILLTRLVLLRGPRPNLPPGPPGLPLIGSLYLLGASPYQSLAELANKYGPLMSLRLGQTPCIIASSPETAMEFLHTQGLNFSARSPLRAADVVFYGQDILFQDASPVWRHLRTIFKTELTGPKRREATRNVRAEEIGQLIRTLPQKSEIELRTYLRKMLHNTLSRLVLNRRMGSEDDDHDQQKKNLLAMKDLEDITNEIRNCLGATYPGDWLPGLKWLDLVQGLEKRFKDTNKRMDSFAAEVIAEHQAERKLGAIVEEEKNILHVLLDELEKPHAKHQITMSNVKGTIWDTFFAGVDTIMVTVEWAMSEALRNPNIMAKAQAELDLVVGQQRRVHESDIPNLSYIQAIVNETMRLHPPIPLMVPHKAIKDCQAFGYDIPADTRLFVNVWAIGRDPSVWPNPYEFTPERFLDGGSNAGIEAKGNDFQLLPFGAGRRMCPGMGLALLTTQYAIANLLHAFKWTDVTKDQSMAEGSIHLSCARIEPLQVIAEPRSSFDSYI